MDVVHKTVRTRIDAIGILMVICLLCSACADKDEFPKGVWQGVIAVHAAEAGSDTLLWQRHEGADLKILAIGNSFTINAATYLPWLVNHLNEDSVCIARLTQSGCSLSMHWDNHVDDMPNYDFYYSDGGGWTLSGIKTIDAALMALNWDIIVIQQQSGLSGVFSSYYPLPGLVALFRETNPNAKIAWHYTWPYREGTNHGDFARYDENPQKMYEAILDAGDKASEDLDIKILSATLIWEMRRQYPEIEDKFSEDGYHISSDLALFALSTLWYECLVAPSLSGSSLGLEQYPGEIDPEQFARAREIIIGLVGGDDLSSAPMLTE